MDRVLPAGAPRTSGRKESGCRLLLDANSARAEGRFGEEEGPDQQLNSRSCFSTGTLGKRPETRFWCAYFLVWIGAIAANYPSGETVA